jgi:hypothetical protein
MRRPLAALSIAALSLGAAACQEDTVPQGPGGDSDEIPGEVLETPGPDGDAGPVEGDAADGIDVDEDPDDVTLPQDE